MSLNILSIPMLDGGLSHQIPLFVLNQTHFQRVEGIKNHFLLPKASHSNFKKKNNIILEYNYSIDANKPSNTIIEQVQKMFDIEVKAFNDVKPDIIIEDCCFTSPLIAEKNNIPRISIQRTGFFRNIPKIKRNNTHKHSLENENNVDVFFISEGHKEYDKTNLSNQNLLVNYLNAHTKIIPGIPSIEKLPNDIIDKNSFFYSGPLLVQDNLSDKILLDNIQQFLIKNKNRKKVFITLGLVSKENISEFIQILLDRDYAVFTTISKDIIKTKFEEQLFTHKFYPLNYICSIVDLVIHQCGSGIYHYPLINKKPAITFGTRCYDREDIALRLEELKLSKHVPSALDNDNHLKIFKSHLIDFEKGYLSDPNQLNSISKEILDTIQNFNPIEVLEHSLNQI